MTKQYQERENGVIVDAEAGSSGMPESDLAVRARAERDAGLATIVPYVYPALTDAEIAEDAARAEQRQKMADLLGLSSVNDLLL